MSCPREDEVLEHFAAGPDANPTLASHLAECDRCRALLADLEATARRLAPEPGEFDDPELARDVLTLIKLNKAPEKRARRWPLAAVPIAALAAGLSLFFLQAPPRDEFQPRSGGAQAPDRWVSIEIYRARDGETGYVRVEGDIRTDDALLFTLRNRPESPYRHAMIFAFDDRGQIFWYYPAYLDADENPISIAAPASEKPIPLGEAVRHQLGPGWLRVVALFSQDPLDVKSVESIVARTIAERGVGAKDLARLPIDAETGQHSFLLRVEAR